MTRSEHEWPVLDHLLARANGPVESLSHVSTLDGILWSHKASSIKMFVSCQLPASVSVAAWNVIIWLW